MQGDKGLHHLATDEMQVGCGNGLVSVTMNLSSQGNNSGKMGSRNGRTSSNSKLNMEASKDVASSCVRT